MPKLEQISPAEFAAQRALKKMTECIHARQNFRMEAGAGAGKTYSLVEALKLIIEEQGTTLQRQHQKVACITYTNVATDEIVSRIDRHPVVYASTIHSFCWELIKNFQPFLRKKVPEIKGWAKKLRESDGVGTQRVDYELGYRFINESHLLLHHDDVLTLAIELMEIRKFRRILTARFPVLFIDEYQDTNAGFAESIVQYFIEPKEGPLIGLFGDSWQKIYGDGVGLIEHNNLKHIGKEANFRSVKNIVDVLNNIRPELPQEVHAPEASGSVKVYHSNEWAGQRQTGGHWTGGLPVDVAHGYLEELRSRLSEDGWDFSSPATKILMLTHNILASEQDYAQIVKAFRFNDAFIKKEDPHIAFLVDTVEPACIAFQKGLYGEMFALIRARSESIRSLADKQALAREMRTLLELRESGTIGEVLDHLKKTRRPRLPDRVQKTEAKLSKASPEEIEGSPTLKQIHKLRAIPYKELSALALFVNDHTPFSTKHGVKGAEFENVLVVFGRGWSQYNWNRFLEWFPDKYPPGKEDSYIRNRNLFYVACSRPKKRLALLFTQELSEDALTTLQSWFGGGNVIPFVIE